MLVHNSLVAIPFGMDAVMIGVDDFLTVKLVVVDVVDVPIVFDRLVAVARQVFVIRCGVPVVHGCGSHS